MLKITQIHGTAVVYSERGIVYLVYYTIHVIKKKKICQKITFGSMYL